MRITDILAMIEDIVNFGNNWRHWSKFQFTASLSAVNFILALYASIIYGPDFHLCISLCITAILFARWGVDLWHYVEGPVKNAQRVREYRRKEKGRLN